MRKRQERILELILASRELSAEEVASKAGVSIATARRDLAVLEWRGLIDREWGSARVRSSVRYPSIYQAAANEMFQEKRAIAAAAAGLVQPGMVIGISGGTTCTEFAKWVRGRPITVVTNALNVAIELYNHARTRVIVTGGVLDAYSFELVGEGVRRGVENFRLETTFIGASGIHPEFGISMRDEPESIAAQALIQASNKVVVLADHSKLGKRTFVHVVSMDDVDLVITDLGLSKEQSDLLAGVEAEIKKVPLLQ